MHLFVDTETTGLPKNYGAPASDSNNWPRIVQIAMVLCDDSGKEFASANFIIKPNGFTIPAEVSAIHGITHERAEKEGLPIENALQVFSSFLRMAESLIAHNFSFDDRIIAAEFYRISAQEEYYKKIKSDKKTLCTMMAATQYCQFPGKNGGYKWPKLEELHQKLFGESFSGAHDAMNDIRACAKCFFEMKKLNLI